MSVSGAIKGNKSDDELCDDIASAAKREAISAQGKSFIMGKCSFPCGGCGDLSSTPSTDTRNGDVQLLTLSLNKHRTKPYGIYQRNLKYHFRQRLSTWRNRRWSHFGQYSQTISALLTWHDVTKNAPCWWKDFRRPFVVWDVSLLRRMFNWPQLLISKTLWSKLNYLYTTVMEDNLPHVMIR